MKYRGQDQVQRGDAFRNTHGAGAALGSEPSGLLESPLLEHCLEESTEPNYPPPSEALQISPYIHNLPGSQVQATGSPEVEMPGLGR